MFSSARYSEDLRIRAIEAVNQRRLRNPRDRSIYREIASELNVGEQSLRLWVRKNDQSRVETRIDPQHAGGSARELGDLDQLQMETELKRLRKQLEKLQEENALLKKAFVVFSSEWSK